MTEKKFALEIITPGAQIFGGDAVRLQVPSTEGYFEVLYNHTPILAALNSGHVKVTSVEGVNLFAVSGGFIEVNNNRVSLLAETAEPVENIDITRAEAAKERAEKRLREKKEETDIARAHAALIRATNRLSVADMKRQ